MMVSEDPNKTDAVFPAKLSAPYFSKSSEIIALEALPEVTEAAVISLIGFIAGFLFCLGINQSVPALGLIVSKYVPRTLFAVEIVYIALAGAGTVFFSWSLFTFFTAIIARRSKRFRLGTGFMNE